LSGGVKQQASVKEATAVHYSQFIFTQLKAQKKKVFFGASQHQLLLIILF